MTVRREHGPGSGTVYIVDDEELLRRALARIVERQGWTPRPCDSGAELVRQLDDSHPACVVLDLSMPVASGVEVQHDLTARAIHLPVIFLTGGGTVPIVADALRDGAFDFIQKPVDDKTILERIGAALLEDSRRVECASARRRFESLTAREQEICALLARGLASKQIARELSISARTVDHHRERVLHKTATTNTAELASLLALARRPPSRMGGEGA